MFYDDESRPQRVINPVFQKLTPETYERLATRDVSDPEQEPPEQAEFDSILLAKFIEVFGE